MMETMPNYSKNTKKQKPVIEKLANLNRDSCRPNQRERQSHKHSNKPFRSGEGTTRSYYSGIPGGIKMQVTIMIALAVVRVWLGAMVWDVLRV